MCFFAHGLQLVVWPNSPSVCLSCTYSFICQIFIGWLLCSRCKFHCNMVSGTRISELRWGRQILTVHHNPITRGQGRILRRRTMWRQNEKMYLESTFYSVKWLYKLSGAKTSTSFIIISVIKLDNRHLRRFQFGPFCDWIVLDTFNKSGFWVDI